MPPESVRVALACAGERVSATIHVLTTLLDFDLKRHVPARGVPVAGKAAPSAEQWERAGGSAFLYPLRLRSAAATDRDAEVFTSHVAPSDLLAHSPAGPLEGLLTGDAADGSSKLLQPPLAGPRIILLPLDVPQQVLHTVMRALYAGSIELSPHTAEDVLQVAMYLGLPAVEQACSDYLLEDCIFCSDGSLDPVAFAAVARLLFHRQRSLAMQPLLLQKAAQLDWSDPQLTWLLEEVLQDPDAACQLLARKLQHTPPGRWPLLCQTQLLECIANAPSKRSALLPLLVDFCAMCEAELRMVCRFAAGQLAGAKGGGGDGFWQQVLVGACTTLLDQPLAPAQGCWFKEVDMAAVVEGGRRAPACEAAHGWPAVVQHMRAQLCASIMPAGVPRSRTSSARHRRPAPLLAQCARPAPARTLTCGASSWTGASTT